MKPKDAHRFELESSDLKDLRDGELLVFSEPDSDTVMVFSLTEQAQECLTDVDFPEGLGDLFE